MFGGKLGFGELLLILAIVLIFFGGRRIPDVMRGLGEGIRSFKEGMSGPDKPAGDKPVEDKK
jgi:sec-independent protein translocase protein TatA